MTYLQQAGIDAVCLPMTPAVDISNERCQRGEAVTAALHLTCGFMPVSPGGGTAAEKSFSTQHAESSASKGIARLSAGSALYRRISLRQR